MMTQNEMSFQHSLSFQMMLREHTKKFLIELFSKKFGVIEK